MSRNTYDNNNKPTPMPAEIRLETKTNGSSEIETKIINEM